MMKRKPIALLVLALAFIPCPCWSATITLNASKDATLFSELPNNSAGGGPGLFVGKIASGSGVRRSLLAFDVASSVPAGSTITSAQLTLHIGKTPNTTGVLMNLRRLLANWGEGTNGSTSTTIAHTGQGFAAGTGDATWNARNSPSTLWTAAGAASEASASLSASATACGPANSAVTWLSTPTLVSDVQGWLNTPATNFGWLLLNNSESTAGTAKAFYSRSATLNEVTLAAIDPTFRPSLAITFTPPPTGDYNGNGVVDAADYVLWRKTLTLPASPAGSGADGNQSGTIDSGDYTYWQARFGNLASGAGSSVSIPEPPSISSMLIGLGILVAYMKKRVQVSR
jgi:hypothetical protein